MKMLSIYLMIAALVATLSVCAVAQEEDLDFEGAFEDEIELVEPELADDLGIPIDEEYLFDDSELDMEEAFDESIEQEEWEGLEDFDFAPSEMIPPLPEMADSFFPEEEETDLIRGLELRGADVSEALWLLFRYTGASFSLDPTVKGKITISLNDVPFEQGLQAVLDQVRATFTKEGSLYKILPLSAITPGSIDTPIVQAPMIRRIIKIDFIDAAEVAWLFGGTWSGATGVYTGATGAGGMQRGGRSGGRSASGASRGGSRSSGGGGRGRSSGRSSSASFSTGGISAGSGGGGGSSRGGGGSRWGGR